MNFSSVPKKGLTSALGAAIPLVALHTSEVGTKEGICTWSVAAL